MSLVRFRSEAPFADLAHLVERHLAKVEVASSSLVVRSIQYFAGACLLQSSIWCHGQVVRQRSAKPSFPSSNLGGTSKLQMRLAKAGRICFFALASFCGPCPAKTAHFLRRLTSGKLAHIMNTAQCILRGVFKTGKPEFCGKGKAL